MAGPVAAAHKRRRPSPCSPNRRLDQRGYYPEVEKALAGRAYVGRLSTSKSLGDPALLKEIALILGEGHYQVIHFNNGLHGSRYSEAAYAQALSSVSAVFRRFAPRARVIWESTTDLLPSFEGDPPALPRIIERNRLASLWAAKNGIHVDDLFRGLPSMRTRKVTGVPEAPGPMMRLTSRAWERYTIRPMASLRAAASGPIVQSPTNARSLSCSRSGTV
jgi:hypothetical protein